MKKVSVVTVAMLMLGAQVVNAQTSTPPDTAAMQLAQATQPAPTPAPAPPPAAQPSTAAAPRPAIYRYGSISGSWLIPSGDFSNIANDGWAITLEGYQFLPPAKKIAVGSQVGYQSFGKKNGVGVSNFPVDAVLKFFPKPGKGKADLYFTGGLGFNYERTDVGHSSSSNYYFGTQAGVGMELHGKGPVGLVTDAVYHWIFSSGTNTDFIALRAGLLVPMMR
jgi:hypothetical protein